MTQYRIIGRFAKDTKPHVVDFDHNWTLEDAKRRLNEIIAEEETEKKRGYSVSQVGYLSVSVQHYAEYELVDLKIQSREVTPWKSL